MTQKQAWQAAAQSSKIWAFSEAQRLLARAQKANKSAVVLETGYGASGLPHIGTFGEVVRTTMVRQAFHLLAPDTPTRLICFSDDMDGLRKVPENVPEQAMLATYLEHPLTAIPDPFGTHESFGAHNNARLKSFLDGFDFDYELISASDYYQQGRFDETLLQVLAHYDAILDIILPTLGEARRASYSPFLPICPHSGKVLMVATAVHDAKAGLIGYTHPDSGEAVETLVTGGACKLQWKADWAMRWAALGVDYEMAGKDLSESVTLSARIVKLLGAEPPEGFSYELFLDENGEKISKTKGNGISIEEWLSYAPPESLSLYMFQSPRKAKRLYFDVIPKAVDEYLTFLGKYEAQTAEEQIANPVWHIHNGDVAASPTPVSFALLLNLAVAANADNKEVLWGFITAYAPAISPATHPLLYRLSDYALRYYRDFVAAHKKYRAPSASEAEALRDLHTRLNALDAKSDAPTIQKTIYDVGQAHFDDNLRGWFQTLYQTLLGQEQGPRFGSFVALYGIGATCALIARALDESIAS